MLNCWGPGSRDDDALRTAKAPRGGATGPRQRDVVAGGSGTENAYQHVGSSLPVIRFASVNRALTTLNGRRQTNVRAGRREAVIYGRNSRILHKRLVERERERLGCLDGLPSSRSRLIPVYMTPGRGRA